MSELLRTLLEPEVGGLWEIGAQEVPVLREHGKMRWISGGKGMGKGRRGKGDTPLKRQEVAGVEKCIYCLALM